MEQLTKNQAVATSQEAVQNQNEPQLRDENAHNDKSVHGVSPNCMFSCLQILEAFLWFVLITLLNVTLIILTLSVSRLLNLLLRLVAFLLFLNPQCLASISRWITASSS